MKLKKTLIMEIRRVEPNRILDLGFSPIDFDVAIFCKERIFSYKRERRVLCNSWRMENYC